MRNDLLCIDVDSIVFDAPEPGCVLYLPGLPGGSSKLCDRSPYGNHGSITGATWKRLPSGVWYLDFDGADDYVLCGNLQGIGLPPVTIKAWINMNQLATAESYHILYGKGVSIVSGMMVGILPAGTIRVYSNSSGQTSIITIDTITEGDWHLIVAQNDGTTSWIYLDGELSKTGAGACVPDATHDLAIGDRGDRYGSFNGKIALYQVYNRILSALEIQNIFNQERHLFGVW